MGVTGARAVVAGAGDVARAAVVVRAGDSRVVQAVSGRPCDPGGCVVVVVTWPVSPPAWIVVCVVAVLPGPTAIDSGMPWALA
jgi:hypothetical protein